MKTAFLLHPNVDQIWLLTMTYSRPFYDAYKDCTFVLYLNNLFSPQLFGNCDIVSSAHIGSVADRNGDMASKPTCCCLVESIGVSPLHLVHSQVKMRAQYNVCERRFCLENKRITGFQQPQSSQGTTNYHRPCNLTATTTLAFFTNPLLSSYLIIDKRSLQNRREVEFPCQSA